MVEGEPDKYGGGKGEYAHSKPVSHATSIVVHLTCMGNEKHHNERYYEDDKAQIYVHSIAQVCVGEVYRDKECGVECKDESNERLSPTHHTRDNEYCNEADSTEYIG